MKNLTTFILLCGFVFSANAQWSPTKLNRSSKIEISKVGEVYTLDLGLLNNQLKNAQEIGQYSKAVEISVPTLNGRMETFAVYSLPVVVKELADKYQLGSYTGVSLQDPTKSIRFSVSPVGFQSMIFSNGSYEFIDPVTGISGKYLVHPKTINTGGKSFICTTEEGGFAKGQIDGLLKKGSNFSNQSGNLNKSSDKKYRTMRLALSVNAEYTTYFGGVANALAAINATMTRVNGVFEKDFALHLNLQNYPSLIYTNAATDPYSNNLNDWNQQLQTTLTNTVGNANYDIGHMFGKSGGGGNAGCIGCVCIDPSSAEPLGKGSGITSPSNGIPQGDTFDIDYVAHEMGHQLGGNHTFSNDLEGTGVNMEPGSGSTIMGYAGITGPDTDVQNNSDPYFHVASIAQVQNNLVDKTCDVETTVVNNSPTIVPLTPYSIPKGTAFVLSAVATDAEGDPMTYNWEEIDDAAVPIDKFNLGNTTTGASFRSVLPSTNPTRYFPKLSSVLSGVLDNSTNQWESVSKIARNSTFAVTVRDNNPDVTQQQTKNAVQSITVGNDGPFTVLTSYADTAAPTNVTWNTANTSASPYNVANVKIDYTTSPTGATWTVLAASTPNDGSENITFPTSLNGQNIKLRISAINNVFYAVNSVNVNPFAACNGTAPTALSATNISLTGATLNWQPIAGATYTVRYRKVSTTAWITANTTNPNLVLTGLNDGTAYEFQVLAICSGTPSPFSASSNFSTLSIVYCAASSNTAANIYISNVTLSNITNPSAGSTYSNFTTNGALQINMVKGNIYSMTINSNVSASDFAAVFIDYNKDGIFSASERVLNFPVANTAVFTGSFTVPNTAVEAQPLRMRILLGFGGATNAGLSAPVEWVCGTNFNDGEIEDYNVVLSANPLATSEINDVKNGIQIYPNPTADILNITNVSDKAMYEIYSVAGQLVIKGSVKNGKVTVSQLLTGNYIIKISEKNIETNIKFIKR